jgi:hypothetical protein
VVQCGMTSRGPSDEPLGEDGVWGVYCGGVIAVVTCLVLVWKRVSWPDAMMQGMLLGGLGAIATMAGFWFWMMGQMVWSIGAEIISKVGNWIR